MRRRRMRRSQRNAYRLSGYGKSYIRRRMRKMRKLWRRS